MLNAPFAEQYAHYKQAVESTLADLLPQSHPQTFYEPMRYTLLSGGKRVRPVLTMMACDAVGGNGMDALYAGIAVEMLHNFTLIHDDIMDAASVRRGNPTVHVKWNQSAAILSGDGMIALAYQTLLRSPDLKRLAELIAAVNTGITEVCEGQALDLEFQDRTQITLEEYFLMIDKKTAKMLELSVQLGGILGNASSGHLEALSQYANASGIAFQVQDDLLDIAADGAKLGKTIGGDILEGKKTFLIIKALEKRDSMSQNDRLLLEHFLAERGLKAEHIPEMQRLFERNGIFEEARAEVATLTEKAHRALDSLPNSHGNAYLHEFATMLLERTH